jgi:hypothetical protein
VRSLHFLRIVVFSGTPYELHVFANSSLPPVVSLFRLLASFCVTL